MQQAIKKFTRLFTIWLTLVAVIGVSAQPDPTRPIVPMSEYKEDYRILDCWQCFEAKGRMCHHRYYESILQYTQSGIRGLGICCKPNANLGVCDPRNEMISCSGKAYDPFPDKFGDVLTGGLWNHQLFAYCPGLSRRHCGLDAENSPDTRLRASEFEQSLDTQELRYREGGDQFQREYDACYYEINIDPFIDRQVLKSIKRKSVDEQLMLYFSVSRKSEVNVYIYAGRSRDRATESIIPGNVQPEIGTQYSVPAEKGMLVVAYPNKDVDTDLKFDYWIGPVVKTTTPSLLEEEVFGLDMSTAIAAAAVLVYLIMALFCLYRRLKKKVAPEDDQANNVQHVKDAEQGLATYPPGGETNRTLLTQEDLITGSNLQIEKTDIKGDYDVKQVIGEGLYGEIHLCLHKITQTKRCVEVIKKAKLSEEIQKKVFKEIEMLKQFDHPNVIKLFQVYVDEKKIYLITELCSGGELFDMIQEHHFFNERTAAKLMDQILQGVSYCHSQGIAHRDLKPENVLCENQGNQPRIKLINFGLSKVFQEEMYDDQALDDMEAMNQPQTMAAPSLQKKKTVVGTAYYIAPEVLKREYDKKCDIWSCGVIMYVLLSGRPPFDGSTDRDILRNVANAELRFEAKIWSQISDQAKGLLKIMFERDPEKRPTAAECLQHEWFKTHMNNLNLGSQKNSALTQEILQNLKQFNGAKKMQQTAMNFIQNNLVDSREKEKMRKVFIAMDTDFDGKLTLEEITVGLRKMGMENPAAEARRVFEIADIDNDGYLEFNEWCTATMNKQKLLKRPRLHAAFKMLDKDGSGTISYEEVRELLQNEYTYYTGQSDRVFQEMVAEMDIDGDGNIDFTEFEKMMTLLIDKGATT